MLLFLIGYMGCGKSSIGRHLARCSQMELIDMDTIIEEREGMSVSELFAQRGEQAFRAMERDLLEELIGAKNTIVSTGGGVPCFLDNMELMNSAGNTVYLKMSAQKLASRLEHGKHKRPLLRDKSEAELIEFVANNLNTREEHYSKAKMIISCDSMSDEHIIEHICMYIKNKN